MPPPPVAVRDELVHLRTSEERLRLAMQAAGIGTCDWNLITGALIWSETLEQIYGLAPGSFEGTREAFLRLVYPADVEFVRHATEACLNGKIPYDIEFRAVAPDGTVRWISDRAEMLRDGNGTAVRWVGAARDITGKKQAERRLGVQYDVARVLAESGTLREASPQILRIICEGLDWETGAIWIVDRDSDSLNFLDIWQQPAETSGLFREATRNFRFGSGVSLPGQVWKSGQPEWLPDVTQDASFLLVSAAEQAGLHTGFGFPLRIGSEVVGVMEFFSRNIRPADADVLRMADSFGAQIGHAIERMRAQEALRRSCQVERELHERANRAHERTARLQAVTSELARASTAGQVADVIINHALAAMGAGGGAVYLLSEDGSLRSLRSTGVPEPVMESLRAWPAGASQPVADAVRTPELIVLSTLEEQYARYPLLAEIPDHRSPAVVAVPMLSKDRAIGAIALAFDAERSFDQEDRALMLNIAQQCAQALDRARLHDQKMAAATLAEASLQKLHSSEARFRRLIESNVIGVVFGASDTISGANRRFLETVGYTHEDLLAARLPWANMTPPEFRVRDERALEELRDRGVFTPYEKEYIRKDGSRVPVLIGGAAVSPGASVCFVIDLTESRRTQHQLLHLQKLESLTVLAGGIAHNFNNLLTAMMGNAGLAQQLAPPGEIQSLLGNVVKSGLEASHLVRQMVAYAGRGRMRLRQLDLARLLCEMNPSLRASIPERIAFEFAADGGLPPVMADSSQIEQLVMNLVLNAAEAIEPEERGLVRIAIGLETRDQDYVTLRVEDNGCGMDEETKRNIFDPFFTTKFAGRGLGLAAVSGIVRGHRGAIDVASKPGEGSRFTIFLPASPV